ncbi:MAG TPA: hypothetical protein VMU59_01320 [Caulobacteraceae bacterium]|nr:hypothetical protein [Caulobacteraceae bacterium]
MMEVVNGYVCLSSCDVALAEQGKNPAHPDLNATQSSVDKTGGADAATSAGGFQSQPSVTFGGGLSQTGANPPSLPGASASAPYQPGAVFSLTA